MYTIIFEPGFQGGRIGSVENTEHENSLEEGIKADQRCGDSICSFSNSREKISLTPLLESISTSHREVKEDVVPFEVDLVEAQISWDIGKALGPKEHILFKGLRAVCLWVSCLGGRGLVVWCAFCCWFGLGGALVLSRVLGWGGCCLAGSVGGCFGFADFVSWSFGAVFYCWGTG